MHNTSKHNTSKQSKSFQIKMKHKEQIKPEQEEKKYTFKKEEEREIAVCIAIQKVGLASIEEIKEKIEKWKGKITEKQILKCAENLRRRNLLSIDLSHKDKNGISVKRYAMKSIKLAIPEVAQVKDVIDDESIKPLKDELERSKKTQKKGLKTFDYYLVNIEFKTKGEVQGFNPDSEGIIRHYTNGKNPVFFAYHFKNWLRDNLPLINRASSVIGDIKFQEGEATLKSQMVIIEKYVTNVESGFSSSRGTGGRGSKKIECLPEGTIIKTGFAIPRDLIPPEKINKAFEIITTLGGGFGGGAKLSTGRLIVDKLEIVNNLLWDE